MKRSIILAIAAAFVLPSLALAGVATTPHDLRAGGGNIGAQDLCFACHVPHSAGSEKLWARDTTGSSFTGVKLLCWTCHDGTAVVLGGDTVMNDALAQHTNVGTDCSGAGACHDVHDNTNGSFLAADTTGGNSTCEACHTTDTTTFANSLGDHSLTGNHPVNGATFTCTSCHALHGAAQQTDDTMFANTTNPILLADNSSGGYYGAMCVGCHNGTGTYGGGTAFTYPTNTYAYDEAAIDGTETKHPTIATTNGSANWAGDPVDGCDNCHGVHTDTAHTREWLLLVDNTNAAYCVSCHNGTTGPSTTADGPGSHFTGTPSVVTMNNGLTPALPWADEQDDSPATGLDYTDGTADLMTCQTCHSVHRAGQDEWLLRATNGTANAICSMCHTDN